MLLPIRLIPLKTSIDFIGYRFSAFFISVFIVIAVTALIIFKGLNYGIDFSGGILIELRSPSNIKVETFRSVLSNYGYHGASIQNLGHTENILIRLQPKNSYNGNYDNRSFEIKTIREILKEEIDPEIEFRKIEYVGPKIGEELIVSGITALLASLLGMMAYIWFRFDWQFGIGAIVSLAHDAIATVGFYIISGYEFDLSSVAAILTIVGYSINDTVVIYDRIRENIKRYRNEKFSKIINLSINETLSRTIMTVATTLLVCLALVVFGGEVLRGFSMALLFGIAFGTYSSIYIAAPILIYTGCKSGIA
jgi:preprotein translocase subunit SecF